MKTEGHDYRSAEKRSKNYFLIAAVFFLMMALVWSVDASLSYIFLGLASFFLFLGFFSRPSAHDGNPFTKSSGQQARQDLGPTSSFGDTLRIFFQRKSVHSNTGTSDQQAIQTRKIVLIVIVFISLMALLPAAVVMFSNDGTYDATGYYAIAEQQYTLQQYDSAYINYRRAINLDPEYAEAIVGYGNVLDVRDEKDSAILMFNRALEIDPDYLDVVYKKGMVLYEQKKYDDGIALLIPFLEENPDYYDAMLLLGDFYYIQVKYDDAILWYEKAYQNGGSRSRMLCHIMAFIYDNKGDYEKAISLYQEALGYDSTVVDIYQRLGELIPGENGNFYRSKAIGLKRQL